MCTFLRGLLFCYDHMGGSFGISVSVLERANPSLSILCLLFGELGMRRVEKISL